MAAGPQTSYNVISVSSPSDLRTTRRERLRPGVGGELRAARLARGLQLSDVADQLLLSTRQIAELEMEQTGAFHNEGFRLRAAQSYARWLGVPDPIEGGDEPEAVAPEVTHPVDQPTARARWPIVVVVGLVVLLVGYVITRRVSGRQQTDRGAEAQPVLPAVSVPAPVPAPAPTPAQSAPEAPAPPQFAITAEEWRDVSGAQRAGQSLQLTVSAPCWLFVRYVDGETVERQLESGEAFPLKGEPAYLALGIERAELSLGGRIQHLDSWASQGQIRINRTGLDQIVSALTSH